MNESIRSCRKWADPGMAHIWYEKHTAGSRLAGGMGGGILTDYVWIHPKLAELGITEKVNAFIRGDAVRLE